MTRAHARVMRSITRAAAKPPLTRPVRGAGVRPSAGERVCAGRRESALSHDARRFAE